MKKKSTTHFNDRLKELRTASGYSQQLIADRLGVARQTYSHWETGIRVPDTASLIQLADIFHIPFVDFLRMLSPNQEVLREQNASDHNTLRDISDYTGFFNDESNRSKYKYLSRNERELIYYFQTLSISEQLKLIDICKVLSDHQK